MTATTTEIDPKAFRRALGNFATGVTIITARGPDGTTVGVTASSFNSLSMDPPLILWSSIKGTPSCAIFEQASHFAVNILAADQMDMSNHFARQQDDKFAGMVWEPGLGGAPIFPNCAELGKMRDHGFFLMLRAVRAYQDRYQPKIETVGLSLIESRILLVLNDLSGLSPEELVLYLHAPINEARAALDTLSDSGLLAAQGGGDMPSLMQASRRPIRVGTSPRTTPRKPLHSSARLRLRHLMRCCASSSPNDQDRSLKGRGSDASVRR